jgi:hypothetical protein
MWNSNGQSHNRHSWPHWGGVFEFLEGDIGEGGGSGGDI